MVHFLIVISQFPRCKVSMNVTDFREKFQKQLKPVFTYMLDQTVLFFKYGTIWNLRNWKQWVVDKKFKSYVVPQAAGNWFYCRVLEM